MPRRKTGLKKPPKQLKFPPEVRICHNNSCLKTFTAKRQKQRFCSPKCRQAVFSFEKERDKITKALAEYHDKLRYALGVPDDNSVRMWSGEDLLATAKSIRFSHDKLAATLAQLTARFSPKDEPINRLIHSLVELSGTEDGLRVLRAKLYTEELLEKFMQYAVHKADCRTLRESSNEAACNCGLMALRAVLRWNDSLCPQCFGTKDNPQLVWRNDHRCPDNFHMSTRLILDEREAYVTSKP